MSITNFSNLSSYTEKFNIANITKNIFQYDTSTLSSNILISNIYSSSNIIILGNTINNNNIFINQNSNIYANIFSPNIYTNIYNNSNIISQNFYININNNFNEPNVISNIISTINNLTVYNTNINGNINVLNNSNINNTIISTGNILFNNSLFVLPERTISILPLGIIMPLYSSTIPNGWLQCNGQNISRNTYNDLFSLIGTTYGIGDGLNTFNLPNTNERFIFGIDRTNNYGLGLTSLNLNGGGNTQTLSIANLPQHTHLGSNGSLSIGSHTHSLTFNNPTYFETFESGAIGRQTGDQLSERQTNVRAWTSLTDNNDVTNINGTLNNTGNSIPFSVIPQHVYLNFIIRAY